MGGREGEWAGPGRCERSERINAKKAPPIEYKTLICHFTVH